MRDTATECYNKGVAVIEIMENEETAETLDFVQAEVMAIGQEETIKSPRYLTVATVVDYVDETFEDVSSDAPSSSTRSISPAESRVPRNFWEKKEMYGRDALKLFETYQEEWDRIANLSVRRLGGADDLPRRKSILHVSPHRLNLRGLTPSAERGTMRSPIRLLNGPSRSPRRDRSFDNPKRERSLEIIKKGSVS